MPHPEYLAFFLLGAIIGSVFSAMIILMPKTKEKEPSRFPSNPNPPPKPPIHQIEDSGTIEFHAGEWVMISEPQPNRLMHGKIVGKNGKRWAVSIGSDKQRFIKILDSENIFKCLEKEGTKNE